MSRRRIRGFTLLELMITIAIAAILISLALPSFQGVMRANRVSTATNELLASLSLARSEAIRNTRGAGICASADGTSCGADWNSGWLVWSDMNGNGAVDADETVVRYTQGKGSTTLTGTASTMAFDQRGRNRGALGTVTVTPSGVATPIRCITVSVTGQTRVAQTACP